MMSPIDWGRYAEIAYVNFGWSPDEFWRATPADFWQAYRGWQKVRGKGQMIAPLTRPLTRDELNQLVSGQGTP